MNATMMGFGFGGAQKPMRPRAMRKQRAGRGVTRGGRADRATRR